jgi:transposase
MTFNPNLPSDVATLQALIVAKDDRIERLEQLVADFKRALFGSKSEKVSTNQYELALEDIEAAMAAIHAEDEQDFSSRDKPKEPRRTNRGVLPKHLPRVEEVIKPDSIICECGCERHIIGEDVSERLDIVPSQFRVLVTRRPKYACRACENGIIQAPAKPHLIEGGIPTEATLATIVINKHADHLPLYRQSNIFARQGVHLDRSTLATWLGRIAHELTPVYECLKANIKQSTKLFMDETTAPVLDPGRGKTKTGYLWALARDDRPWGGSAPPCVVFTYAPSRAGKHAVEILQGFEGILQVDGYTGYNSVKDRRDNEPVELAYCWAHARRKLFELTINNVAPIAEEGIKQIKAFYRIEAQIRGLSVEERLTIRQEKTLPRMKNFEQWLAYNRAQVSAKSPTGLALKYIAKYWNGLNLFLADGRIEIDNNAVERSMRPIALNRKNALFAGHDVGAQNWAMFASIIETCKLNKVEPHAYLTGVLSAIALGHKQRDIEQLLPWNFGK